jgi:hypothetical protein
VSSPNIVPEVHGSKANSQGLVAVLDALGASSFTDVQVSHFIGTRNSVVELLHGHVEEMSVQGKAGELSGAQLSTFTFGDTVLIAYEFVGPLSETVIIRFCALIRQFVVNSLLHKIMFRGAIGCGQFYLDNASNTVMGDAVSDAASWYEQADWLGVIATPRTSLAIERLLGPGTPKQRWALLDYDVPLKAGRSERLKCINWPKVFMVPKLMPPAGGDQDPRKRFLSCLGDQSVPFGTESKYFNSLKFFDHSVAVEHAKPHKKST